MDSRNELLIRLTECICDGVELNLPGSSAPPVTPNMRMVDSWGASREISAIRIRQLLIGQGTYVQRRPDPQGVKIRGAVIRGRLDISNLTSDISLSLTECFLPDGIKASSSSLNQISLKNCLIGGSKYSSPEPKLLFEDTNISSSLCLSGSKIVNHKGPCLDLGGARIASDVLMESHFIAKSASGKGAIIFAGAHIGGQLRIEDSKIINRLGPALVGDRMIVDSSVFLSSPFEARGADSLGAIRLLGASIAGQLNIVDAEIINKSGPAIIADCLKVGGTLSLRNLNPDSKYCVIEGQTQKGAIRLIDSVVGGQLVMNSVSVINGSGPATDADGIQTGSSMIMNFFADCRSDEKGSVRLNGAEIGRALNLNITSLKNENGPILTADNLRVKSDMKIFSHDESGPTPFRSVHMKGAHIGGKLSVEFQSVASSRDLLFGAPYLIVDLDMEIDFSFEVIEENIFKCVDLEHAQVRGKLIISDKTLQSAFKGAKWNIDGLEYSGCPVRGEVLSDRVKSWTKFIQSGTCGYAAQPYRVFANQLMSSGHRTQAKKVLIAQRDHRRLQVKSPSIQRSIDWLLRFTIRYGYQPVRAIGGLALLCFVAGILIFSIPNSTYSKPEVVVNSSTTGLSATNVNDSDLAVGETLKLSECTWVEKSLMAVDVAVPLIASGASLKCSIRYGDYGGDLLGSLLLVVRCLAWAFAALFVAGFTNVVRR